MDEIKLLDNKRTLDFYELILTENCNLRCKYCFDDSYSDRSECNYNYSMPLSMIDDIINFIENTKMIGVNPLISFFGGEPTVNWRFLCEFVNRTKKLHYRYSMNTNATNIDDEKLKFIIDNRISLTVSIDGIKEAHDANRVFVSGDGSWDKIVEKLPNIITKIHTNKMNISAMMVISNNNYKYLERSYEFLSKIFDEVNILWNYDSDYTEESYDIIKKQLISLFFIKGKKMFLDLHRKILSERAHCGNSSCVIPEKSITISTDGGLYFCHRLVPKMNDELHKCNKEKFGDIYQGFYNTEYINLIRDRIDFSKFRVGRECDTCKAAPFCKGGCIGSIRNISGGYNGIPSLCRIQKMLADIFLGSGD